ncbi:unnamed protein product [Onchocerca flexuosa]|uniref:CN hydrolase domain-containing protein n=1 Tax=Onchocerca flexuosa TaxID=387005 RepID=A0A183HU08_9BILA|nr:unnamed protein product [Onchocerca flexuosa]
MPPTGSLNLSLQVAGNPTVNTTGGNDDERIWPKMKEEKMESVIILPEAHSWGKDFSLPKVASWTQILSEVSANGISNSAPGTILFLGNGVKFYLIFHM